MPEQPFVLNPQNLKQFARQIQQMLDNLYNERLAGAMVGDVFEVNSQSDALTLKLSSTSGLTKSGGTLLILVNPSGPLTLGSGGLDIAIVSTTKKGACPTLPNDDTKFFDGKGNWTAVNTGNVFLDGIILIDTQTPPHYWEVTVNNTGNLVTVDLGTSLP